MILAGVAPTQQRLATADFDLRPQEGEHSAWLALFLDALRSEIGVSGSFDVVRPHCPEGCSPARTSFEDIAVATDRAGAKLRLVSRNISTLIGTINVVAHRQGIDRRPEQL